MAVVTVSPLLPLCLYFFFSSRRRHTRLQGDWSSDVCSSDLAVLRPQARHFLFKQPHIPRPQQSVHKLKHMQMRSEERRVGKSVDLGGRRIIKKKKKTNK